MIWQNDFVRLLVAICAVLLVLWVIITVTHEIAWTDDSGEENAALITNSTSTDTQDRDEPTTVASSTATSSPVSTDNSDLIRVVVPEAGASVTSPVTVRGEVRGTWFFEASFPITVVDWDGRIIGEGYVTAEDDWMTESFVPFSGSVTFSVPADTAYSRGTIILRKSNPSGRPENSDAVEIPVQFE